MPHKVEWVRRIFRAQSLDEERTLMLNAEEWPIACKVNFGPTTELGEPVASAPAKVWREQLAQVADLGFKYIDPMDDWVPLADLDAGRFAQFRQVLTDTHLSVAAISIGRHSIVDVDRGRENLQTIHRTIDRAAELGASVVDLGFMQALTPAQRGALWFWLAEGHHDDPTLRPLAIERVRELADHAERRGIELSLEMYEDTFLGTPQDAVRFINDVDHPAVGLNPDIGNLVRLHRPMPSAREMYSQVLPYANYWHIKNYIRDEDPMTGSYMSAPAPLKYGVINYREIIRMAIRLGFRGAFMAEQYGGDWLGVGAENADYIRQVIRSA